MMKRQINNKQFFTYVVFAFNATFLINLYLSQLVVEAPLRSLDEKAEDAKFAIKEPKQPKQDIASIRQVDKHIRETQKFIADKYWRLCKTKLNSPEDYCSKAREFEQQAWQ
ncbi:MAG: hypothetical protein KME29_31690 [Calothrix sp. FI2-JRJ7]|jgi:hypothetical protein|nr:hypothetical protein [Calothrix sp. FI2-JRJ7]